MKTSPIPKLYLYKFFSYTFVILFNDLRFSWGWSAWLLSYLPLASNPSLSSLFCTSRYAVRLSSVVAQSCLTLCHPRDCSIPGLPVHHQLLEFIQTHVHCVSDAIQPSYPLSSPSSPAFNLSQHQGLFKWVSSSHQVAKDWCWSFSFNISPSNKYSGLISFTIDWISLQAKGLPRVFSNTTVQKHQFFGAQLSL